MGATENGWPEMKRLIEYRLDIIDKKMDAAADERAGLRQDVVELKIKGGLWGALSGAIAGLGAYFGSRLVG